MPTKDIKKVRLEIRCDACGQSRRRKQVPRTLFMALKEREEDYKKGLIPLELFLFEINCCLSNNKF